MWRYLNQLLCLQLNNLNIIKYINYIKFNERVVYDKVLNFNSLLWLDEHGNIFKEIIQEDGTKKYIVTHFGTSTIDEETIIQIVAVDEYAN